MLGALYFTPPEMFLRTWFKWLWLKLPNCMTTPVTAGAKRASPSVAFLLKSEMEVLPGRWATTTPFVFASCESKPALNII